MKANVTKIPQSFFHNPDETQRAVLGKGYISSILTEGTMRKSIMVLTDKRLYVCGRSFGGESGRSTFRYTRKTVVALRDIVCTQSEVVIPWLTIVIGALMTLLGIIGILHYLNTRNQDLLPFIILVLVLGVLCILAGLLGRRKCFFVYHGGGRIGTRCDWYPNEEIDEFQRCVSTETDRIRESEHNRLQILHTDGA